MSATQKAAPVPQEPNPPASATTLRQAKPADSSSSNSSSILGKGKKLLGLGKKKGDEGDRPAMEQTGTTAAPAASTTATTTNKTTTTTLAPTLLPSPPMSPPERRASPRGSPRMLPVGASPSRRIRSTSPNLHSPASSLIFERNVQEPEPSVDVPAHIKTEDHIPPALDATSLAITDTQLNPDEVEIVTHSAHQPVAMAVAGSMAESLHSPLMAPEESAASSHVDAGESTAPGYGALDTTDPRRLSFISFADVVQAEHVEHDRQEVLGATSGEALQFMSLSSTANRSPSPVRSIASSPPTTSGAASPKATDLARTRSPGSPTSPIVLGHPTPAFGEELPVQIETMRQALRKTRSGDLGGIGSPSQPVSAVGGEDKTGDKAPFK
ncbi:hypothetical protein COCVIDRAFT_32947 [Bipolaris victoriae FI3]|uniref:Uncharacterized protein n=1 Tax=Bipolaris victoriae (strain FI3) TaxID=930091 RepID=W7EWF6_BIPV3|nr:hypothetical protein COCVIDRAFT_32947 [Bipolaris victoriae FI3]